MCCWPSSTWYPAFRWTEAGCFGRAFGGFVPLLGGGIFSGVWLVLIGWFLSRAARSSYEQLVRTQILEQTPVHRLIRSAPSSVRPETTLSTLMETVAMDADQSSFMVKREGRWLGLVDLSQVLSVPRSQWEERRVDEVMTPAEQLRSVDKDQDADDALRAMAEQGVDQLPVTARGGAFEGVIRQKDILRWTFLQGQGAPA